jgi:hypothetical protein
MFFACAAFFISGSAALSGLPCFAHIGKHGLPSLSLQAKRRQNQLYTSTLFAGVIPFGIKSFFGTAHHRGDLTPGPSPKERGTASPQLPACIDFPILSPACSSREQRRRAVAGNGGAAKWAGLENGSNGGIGTLGTLGTVASGIGYLSPPKYLIK